MGSRSGNLEKIEIQPIKKEVMTVTIEGDTDLLSARIPDWVAEVILRKNQGLPQVERQWSEDEHYQQSIYRTQDGRPGFPATAIKSACIDACTFVAGIGMKQSRGALFILGEILPIEESEPEKEVVLVRSKGTTLVPCVRARYRVPWSITFNVLYFPSVISATSVVHLINCAGTTVGIGPHRAQSRRGGSNGFFHVRES